ncbi:hypothetical protein SAMN04487775_107133 [Treponema bryantii]|uniref:Uncharacterized protein n=1 Tax=Treponema bryantii TaxID=163 RepID=A0A1I3LQC7_9SPIR|nr:hypothetical protein [Treponema bryantii]SFI86948.1 hypothetical protein SAMN04487775_107133 [Treponema bryantii]
MHTYAGKWVADPWDINQADNVNNEILQELKRSNALQEARLYEDIRYHNTSPLPSSDFQIRQAPVYQPIEIDGIGKEIGGCIDSLLDLGDMMLGLGQK